MRKGLGGILVAAVLLATPLAGATVKQEARGTGEKVQTTASPRVGAFEELRVGFFTLLARFFPGDWFERRAFEDRGSRGDDEKSAPVANECSDGARGNWVPGGCS